MVCVCLVVLIALSGCSKETPGVGSEENSQTMGETLPSISTDLPGTVPTPPISKPDLNFKSNPTMEGIDTSFAKNYSEMFTERDLNGSYDESNSAIVQLDHDKIISSSKAVSISGSKVMLSEEGTYIFSGTLYNGMIIVDAEKTAKIQIVLNGVDINSSDGAAIYVRSADKVFITLAPETENKLSNGGNFVQTDENNVDAVIFSKQDLTINGGGILFVESPAGHGIVSKDDLVLAGGSYIINAASRGLDANDSVRIASSFVKIQSGKDGIRAQNGSDPSLGFVYINDGDYDISAEGDAISASSNVQIDCGSFKLRSGAGVTEINETSPSMKGIKAAGNLLVVDGSFEIQSVEDAVNAKGSVILADGTYAVKAGDDAFQADRDLYAVNAKITVSESKQGLKALNVDIRGGRLKLNSSGDGIHVSVPNDTTQTISSLVKGSLKISGGETTINAKGDGIDVNGSFSMSDGLLRISVSATEGKSIYKYESGGEISGGILIASGSASVAQIPTASSQGIITVTTGSQMAGTAFSIADSDGELILLEEPTYDYEVIIVSMKKLSKGNEYKITVGSESATFKAQ